MTMSGQGRTRAGHPIAALASPAPNGGLSRGYALTRSAAALAWASGLGFGLCGVYGAWHLVRYGEIASVMGYPTYGEGIFDHRFGIRTSVPLLVAFVLVCVAECRAGWLLWNRRRSGRVLALALVPIEMVFWVGFSLPYGPVLGAARTVLVLADLRERDRMRRASTRSSPPATPLSPTL